MSMLDNAALEALRSRFASERPIYEALATEVESQARIGAGDRRIQCMVSSRAKDIPSFVKKALAKQYEEPYDQIRDKAGIRVVASYRDDLEKIEALVDEMFVVGERTDKDSLLEVDQLGYRGVHFEVQLREQKIQTVMGHEIDLQSLICEVQVQTRAQNLWNDASHSFLYKPHQPLPKPIARSIFRLEALMEIFDEALLATRKAMLEQPGSESAAILSRLEDHFFQLTAASYSKELSFQVIDLLRDLLAEKDKAEIDQLIDDFVARRGNQLAQMYRDYAGVPTANPLIFQPETILVLERLERDSFELKDRWSEEYPLSLLEELSAVWGVAW